MYLDRNEVYGLVDGTIDFQKQKKRHNSLSTPKNRNSYFFYFIRYNQSCYVGRIVLVDCMQNVLLHNENGIRSITNNFVYQCKKCTMKGRYL